MDEAARAERDERFDEVFLRWAEDVEGHFEKSTVKAYVGQVVDFYLCCFAFGVDPLLCSKGDIERFLSGLEIFGLSVKTREQAVSALRSFFRSAVRSGVLPRSPMGDVEWERTEASGLTRWLYFQRWVELAAESRRGRVAGEELKKQDRRLGELNRLLARVGTTIVDAQRLTIEDRDQPWD